MVIIFQQNIKMIVNFFAENVFIIFLVGRDDDDVENDIEKNKIQVLIIKKSKNLFMDDKSCKNFIFS